MIPHLQIVSLIEKEHELMGEGRYKTAKNHDSLVVDTTNNYYFWNSRNESGDAIDWVGRYICGHGSNWNSRNALQFKEALQEISKITGQPFETLRPEPPEVRAKRKSEQEIRNKAKAYFIECLRDTDLAVDYVAKRGLTRNGFLGYSDGKLHQALTKDEQHLAHEMGLLADRKDAIPSGYLVYIHHSQIHQQPVYFAGRAINEKKHFNQRGAKKPFWAVHKNGGALFVCEGQADALTYYEWNKNSVALCGTNQSGLDWEWLKQFEVYLALDGDKAGDKALDKLGQRLPTAKLISLPECYFLAQKQAKDANDLRQIGLTAEQLAEIMACSPSYLTHFIGTCTVPMPAPQLELCFEMLAKLNEFDRLPYRKILCDMLELSKGDFDRFLAKANDKEANFQRGEQYTVEDNWMLWVAKMNGSTVKIPLLNADLKINQLISHDDGTETWSEYLILGQKGETANVPTAEYEAMKWIYDQMPWLTIGAGRAIKDHLRAAIQFRSNGFTKRTIFEHMGWRQIDGKWAYLTTNGAIGSESGVEVDLKLGQSESNMSRYSMPLQAENIHEAIQASLNFWHVHKPEVTIPQWGACMLSVLSPFVTTDFGLWVYGKSGSFKSVIAALVLAHFGEWGGRDGRLGLPANFSGTSNYTLMCAFLAKDALLVIDDYAPGNTPREMKERNETASRLLRSLGNKAGRGRMKDGRKMQKDMPPRCLALITAEDIPDGQSILARGVGVRVPVLANRGTTEREEMEKKISYAQETESPLYRHAMTAFIQWIQRHWEEVADILPKSVEKHQKDIQAEGHARLTDAYAKLMAAIDLWLFFATDAGVITAVQAEAHSQEAAKALATVIADHSGNIEALDPVHIFKETLREQLDDGEWVLEDKNFVKPEYDKYDPNSPEQKRLGNIRRIGWQDDTYVYLLPKYVSNVMEIYTRTTGVPFPVGRNTFYSRLVDKGWLCSIGEKTTMTVFIASENTSVRVLQIKREAIFND